MMALSKRLGALCGLVPRCHTVADVGCDHGFVSICLVEEHRAERAVAMDVREGPLQRAREHIAEHGLTDAIDARLGDGLEKLSAGEAEAIVIAGMGGGVMLHILRQGGAVLAAGPALVLQPQSEVEKVRRFLYAAGYRILREDMVEEDGKYYPMMLAQPADAEADDNGVGDSVFGGDILSPEEAAFGPCLLRQRHEVLRRYLEWRLKILSNLREQLRETSKESPGAGRRLVSLEEEVQLVRRGLAYWEA